MSSVTRDFTSISPSAMSLIGLKAYTSIPFASEAAGFLKEHLAAASQHKEQMDKATFFKMLVHFENRYRTVDKVLSDLPVTNIIEISSGYSFRGLHLCYNKPIYFIDTDLPHVIALKEGIVEKLIETKPESLKGKLKLQSLNALNKDGFEAIADSLPSGSLAIVNEGLLVYLNTEEKSQLASIIAAILRKHRGYWITGDIYTKKDNDEEKLIPSGESKNFRQFHRIDENKFESFEKAEQFFASHGFKVIQRAPLALNDLSCLELLGERKAGVIDKLKHTQQSRETWCLQLA